LFEILNFMMVVDGEVDLGRRNKLEREWMEAI
jgi:hypothetical protein